MSLEEDSPSHDPGAGLRLRQAIPRRDRPPTIPARAVDPLGDPAVSPPGSAAPQLSVDVSGVGESSAEVPPDLGESSTVSNAGAALSLV